VAAAFLLSWTAVVLALAAATVGLMVGVVVIITSYLLEW